MPDISAPERIDRQLPLRPRHTDSSQAFVAMWFDESLEPAYEKRIAPAVEASGYSPLRIDRKEHVERIDDQIIAEIRRSRFIVCDFTCGLITQADGEEVAVPRGGVYFEAGFAQGLNIPVIWTCRKNCIEHVHFDTRQFAHILWAAPKDLQEQLKQRSGNRRRPSAKSVALPRRAGRQGDATGEQPCSASGRSI